MQGRKTLFSDIMIRPKKVSKSKKHKSNILSPSPRSNPFSTFKYCEKETCAKSNSPNSDKLPRLRAISPTYNNNPSQKRANTIQCFPSHFVSLKIIPKTSVISCHPAKTPTFVEFDED